MRIYTIGFTKRSASNFFGSLENAQVSRLVDVRLNNVSQLAGFAKRDDLTFFTDRLLRAQYKHDLDLAPTAEMLDAYRKKRIGWIEYAQRFTDLMEARQVELGAGAMLREGDCLLCSESTPERCHRRLVLDYLTRKGLDFEVSHL